MKKFSGLLASILLLVAPAFGDQKRFQRLVAIGDSLTAGFQNFSLFEGFQTESYANLVAEKAGTSLVLPLVSYPGAPAMLQLEGGVIAPLPAPPGVRVNAGTQATNLAVPGQTLNEIMTMRPDCSTQAGVPGLTNLVLGLPGCITNQLRSQLEWVEALDADKDTRPTAILAWAGNNDALFSVLLGSEQMVTPPAVFALQYSEFLARLRKTKALVVVASIPDVTAIPYLTPVAALASQMGIGPDVLAADLGVGVGDYLLPGAVLQTLAAAQAGMPIPDLGTTCAGPVTTLGPTACYLTASQVASIQRTVDVYNWIIAAMAAANKVPVADINALFKNLVQNGIVVNGQLLTVAPLGGIFSLDMVHPTNIGQAIIANEFIRTINAAYKENLQLIDLSTVTN